MPRPNDDPILSDETPHDDGDEYVTRRDFVKRAAAGAAVAPLVVHCGTPWTSAGGALAAASDPEVLTVGLVGCGGRGTGAAYNALSAEQGTVRLTAMADVFPERIDSSLGHLREALGPERADLADVDPEHRFAGFDGYAKVIDSGVDVVLLAAPPHFRPAHLRAAVDAGKHVFCEKPMAVDAAGVRSVLETARRARAARLSLVSGFCWRYNVRHRELYARVLDGAVGDLRSVYSTYNATPLATHERQPGWSDMEFQLRNWQHFVWLSGDHVNEQAVHSLDKMAWALGDRPPLSVTAVGGRQAHRGPATGNVYDHFSATFDYADGVKGFHMCRQMSNCSTDNSDWIMGAKGVATIQGWGPVHKIEGERPWVYEGDGNDMYQTELDELFAAIRRGEPVNDGEWMARSTMLAVMVRLAAYTGQTLSWDQVFGSAEQLGPEAYTFGDLAVEPVAVPGVTALV